MVHEVKKIEMGFVNSLQRFFNLHSFADANGISYDEFMDITDFCESSGLSKTLDDIEKEINKRIVEKRKKLS